MHGSTFTIKKSFEIIKIPFSSIYSLEFLQELIGAIDELEAEAKEVELSGVIIQSSSKSVFSAGLDLQEMLKPDRARLTEFWSNLQEFWIRLYGCQVWPLTQLFLFPFCENSLICLEGKSMTPHRGNTILFRSSQQFPRLRLGPSKGFLS